MSDDWFDETYRSNETTPAELDARVLSAARSAVRRRWFPRAAAVAGGAGGAVRRRPLLAVAGTAIAAATAAFVALPVLDRGGFEPPSPASWDGTDAVRRRSPVTLGAPPPQTASELALERPSMPPATPKTKTLGPASAMESRDAAVAETASAGASGPMPAAPDVLSPMTAPVESPSPPAFHASGIPLEGMPEPESPDIAVTAYGATARLRTEMEAVTITRTEEVGFGEHARGHGAPIGGEEVAGASVPRPGALPGPRPFGREATAGAPARRESVVTLFAVSEAACIPNVLRGPLGGPGRADEAHWCPNGRGGLEIDFVWDGGAPCPSRLVVEDAANVRAVLDGTVLVAGRTRYRCIEGRWARVE